MPKQTSRFGHNFSRLLIAVAVCAGSCIVASPPAFAGGSNLWATSDRSCFDAFGNSVVFLTSLAPNLDEAPNIWDNPYKPSGTVTGTSPLVLSFQVPDGYFDSERAVTDEDEFMGFYLMSVEFVDDCTNLQTVDFDPCFDTTHGPAPWIIDLGDLHLMFFMYATWDPFGISRIVIHQQRDPECLQDPSEPLPGGVDEGDLVDLVDEFGLEFEGDLTPNYRFDFSLDPYLERAAAELPDTL